MLDVCLCFFISLYSALPGDAAPQHVRIPWWCFHCEGGGDEGKRGTWTTYPSVWFCLQRVRANTGRDQTFTNYRGTRGIRV